LCVKLVIYKNTRISFRGVHIYCPIWVKFGPRDLQIMLLVIFECRENRRMECLIFITGANGIHLCVYREICDLSRVLSALQYVYRVAEDTICIIIATIEAYRTPRLIG
jgi:hypothetical protein